MSSKRTRRKGAAAAESPAANAAADEAGAPETDFAEDDFAAGDEDDFAAGDEAASAGESVGRLEESLDALDAEVGAETPEEEAADGFDIDPAGGLGAPDGEEADDEADEEGADLYAGAAEAAGDEADPDGPEALTPEGGEADAPAEGEDEAGEDEDAAEGGDEGDDEEEEGGDDDEEEDGEEDGDEEGESGASGVVIFDADAEDREEELARRAAELKAAGAAAAGETAEDEIAPGGKPRELAELVAVCEALIFVSEEPLTTKAIAEVLGEDKGWVQVAVEQLASEYGERNGGLMVREVAGGWQIATRPEHHENIRAYLKSRPSAKLSLAALETLAVIAYKQPVTVPEILEIRGVQSSSAIKTLLDKRLIVAKGRKEVVGRPMMYGTSKEFLLQFGLRDLSELPSIEDFEDLAAGES